MNNDYGTLETQIELLKMMKDLHVFLVDNSINYSLCGGNLLGAIRHDGFIPWDDDFDIVMSRSEFNKFFNKYKKLTDTPYVLERDGWVWRIRNREKLVGGVPPTIDFFIMEPVTRNSVLYMVQIALLRILQGLLKEHYYWERYSIFFKICLKITYYMGKLFNRERLFKAYDSISQWGYKNPSDKCSQFNDQFKILTVKYDSNVLDGFILHKFEDTEFYILKHYDHFLRTQYGDYMKLPQEKDRKPMHGAED